MNKQQVNQTTFRITRTAEDRSSAIDLLRQNNLPVTDIDEHKQLYVLMTGEEIIGTAGLEVFEDSALLRSVSVAKEQQGKGYGKIIIREIEKRAKAQGIECLYLLTTTSKDFFEQLGYSAVERAAVPAAIKQTAEFTSLCPSSAVLMKKRI